MLRRLSIYTALLFSLIIANQVFAVEHKKVLRVGTVNSAEIIKNYAEAQKLLNDLSKAEKTITDKLSSKRQEIEKAKAANKTETELKLLVEQLRMELEPEAKRLEADTKKRSAQIEANVKAAIGEIAEDKHYHLVLSQEAVLYGGTDISNEIITKLNATKKK